MFQSLSSENRSPFSFNELKCSPRGAPSINSIMIYNLSSTEKQKLSINKQEMIIQTQSKRAKQFQVDLVHA